MKIIIDVSEIGFDFTKSLTENIKEIIESHNYRNIELLGTVGFDT